MRKIANAEQNTSGVRRAMIYEVDGGAYLFLYTTLEDGACNSDEWYATTADAETACKDRYGISSPAWQVIADPLEGCQHDWIAAVRVKGRDIDKSE